MSNIIKSANATGIATLHALGAPITVPVTADAEDEERRSMVHRIAWLESDLRRCGEEVVELRSEIERAREEGREQGYESGLVAAEDRQAERLALLESAMQRAHASLVESMQSVVRLAPLLAQDCVDIILGDTANRADHVAGIVEKQLALLDRAMLVGIRVSRLDFPDDAALAALSARVAPDAVHLVAAEEIPAGGCTMVMRLGCIQVGIDQQWPVLRALLGEMSLPEIPR